MPRQGGHPKIVSERLGHGSVAITLDIYSHVVPGLQEAAARRFDDVMFESLMGGAQFIMIMGLNEREKGILKLRFGLHGNRHHTCQQVGNQFGMTRDRVQEIEWHALGKVVCRQLSDTQIRELVSRELKWVAKA